MVVVFPLLCVISVFFLALFPTANGQDFEIGPDILLAGSPAAMLFALLESQQDLSGTLKTLTALPSVCKTKGLEGVPQVLAGEAPVDCNLSKVKPDCFLVHLAGQVGRSWGTQEIDEEKAANLIEKLLKPQGLTLHAAAVACAAAPLVVPLLQQFGLDINPPSEVVSAATLACTQP